jgi:hypothetical protein
MDCGVGWYWTVAVFEDSVLLQPTNANIGTIKSMTANLSIFIFCSYVFDLRALP